MKKGAATPKAAGSAAWSFHPLDLLLVAIPVALALRFVPAWKNDTALFFASGLAMIPLAGWMSRATENLGERTRPRISGFLNATFSNAPELIIAIMALSKGLIAVVKASIIGSILGNILVVLGFSMLAGGVALSAPSLQPDRHPGGGDVTDPRHHRAHHPQRFPIFRRTNFPNIAAQRRDKPVHGHRRRSPGHLRAVVGLFMVSHKELFAKEGEAAHEDVSAAKEVAWPLSKGLLVLALSTFLIAVLSEFLAGSVESACRNSG